MKYSNLNQKPIQAFFVTYLCLFGFLRLLDDIWGHYTDTASNGSVFIYVFPLLIAFKDLIVYYSKTYIDALED